MNLASMGATSLAGSTAWAGVAAHDLRISDVVAVHLGRQLQGEPDRLVVEQGPELQFRHGSASPGFCKGFEHEVAIDQDPDLEPWTYGKRRLDVQATADHLLAGLVQGVGRPLAKSLDQPVLVVARPDLGSPTPRIEDRAAALNNWPQWLSTPSSSPAFPAGSAPGRRSSTMERPSGRISLVQTSSTRDCPNATPLSYWPTNRDP